MQRQRLRGIDHRVAQSRNKDTRPQPDRRSDLCCAVQFVPDVVPGKRRVEEICLRVSEFFGELDELRRIAAWCNSECDIEVNHWIFGPLCDGHAATWPHL